MCIVEEDDNFFGQNIYNDDAIMSIVRNELHLFYWLSVGPMEDQEPFVIVGKPCNAISTCVFFGLSSARDCGVSNRENFFSNVHGIITNLNSQGLELITWIILSWLSKIGLTC